MSAPFLRDHPEGCTLAVRVQPGAKKTTVTGICGEASRPHLNISLQAPAVEGKANQALTAYLAKLLSTSRSKIKIIHGEHDRFKLVLIQRKTSSQIEAILNPDPGLPDSLRNEH